MSSYPEIPAHDSRMFDVCVVGAGLMGSATAYSLIKSNPKLKVLLLEQFDFLHRRGSSHGDSRIIRMTYSQEHYTQLMNSAYRLWAQIEQESGSKIFTKTGGLDFGKADNPDLLQLIRIAKKYGVQTDILQPSDVRRKFPQITVPEGWIAVYSPSSGILNASKAVSVLQNLAARRGCTLMDNVKVEAIKRDLFCYEITTPKGIFQARRVVVTAGPWTNKILKGETPLLSPRLEIPLTPKQPTVAYWKVDESLVDSYHSSNFPVFINYDEPMIYGTPCHEFPGLLKCCPHYGKVVDPDTRDFAPGMEALENQVASFVRTFFKGVEPKPFRTESCLYTDTPDENFVIDAIPGHDGKLLVGCGFSGHGFKLGPVVGEMMSEMALNDGISPTYSNIMKNFSMHRDFYAKAKAAQKSDSSKL